MARKKSKGWSPVKQLRSALRPDWRWLIALPTFFLLNGLVQVVRIPSQATGPLEPYFYKTPPTTWEIHGAAFQAHATPLMSPTFLAALAQVEAGGNPIATTYWKWRWSLNPFRWYAPASSAAGLFQITDGTFAESRRYCIQGGRSVEQGKWYEWGGCWFNFLYNRLSANHATEMTSAYLDHQTAELLSRSKAKAALPAQRRTAAVIHLCGPAYGSKFVRSGFRTAKGQRCGDHSVAAYLKKVESYQGTFERLAGK